MRYNTNFRDEIVATALLMGLVITGSFFMAYRSVKKPATKSLNIEGEEQVLGDTDEEKIKEIVNEMLSTPTPQPMQPTNQVVQTYQPNNSTSSADITTPPYSTNVIEQPYGASGEYDNTDYRLTIFNPRLIISSSRTFRVDVILANKSVEEGLKNRLSATIIKEGSVIAESAPFSLSESTTVLPGEQITFTSTISLISGTDVTRVIYSPLIEGLPETTHDL
ncbi:hypothetical protein ACFL1M_03990 [Patescibacteria group bacterium]